MSSKSEKRLKGEPLKGQAVVVETDGYGTLREYPDYEDKPRHWSFWSTDDPAKIKPALELLVCSGCNFSIAIKDFSYKLNRPVVLELSRGTQWSGPFAKDHEFYVKLFDSGRDEQDLSTTHKKPVDAMDKFFQLWEEFEVGEYWVDAGFGGSGCPASVMDEGE